ncbi:MAG: hypothetical protein PHE89_01865 [Alphaproteobacteria bacterium]|nr:hypothetical protein [Alphaproteobacteria bacterium]
MKKTKTYLICLSFLFASQNVVAGELELNHELNVRGYYGVSQSKKKPSNNNMSNRLVNRNDFKGSATYDFENDYKLGIHNSSSLIYRQHDATYNHDGEWRFYNYGMFTTPYGSFIGGQDFNVAHRFHRGAKDFGPMGIDDSNMTWFLGDANWKNGKNSVAFLTPKSSSMMDDGRALKFSYITPKVFENTIFGFTYTPNTPSRRGLISRYNDYAHDDAYVMAMHNEWEIDSGDLYTSAGYGFFNRNTQTLTLGATYLQGNWSFATGYRNSFTYGDESITKTSTNSRLPVFYDNYRESWSWDASVGYKFGPIKTSVAYLHTQAKKTDNQDDLFIWNNTYAYSKMIDFYLIGGYLKARGDNKLPANNNRGYAAVAGIGLNF